jgi:hypothetical protein
MKMKMKTAVWQLAIFTLLTGAVAAAPALAGSAVIGSVAGSTNATLGGHSLLPNTTIFSGDSVLVKDGVAVIAVGNSNRVIFGHDTVASFLRQSNEVTVVLSRGNVSMVHPNEGSAMKVQAGAVSITPLGGFKTLGEVAMVNGSVVVTAKEGSLQVQDNRGDSKNVAKGQTVVISPKTADVHGSGGGWGSNANVTLEIVTLGAAATGAVLGGVAVSRAGNAETSANEAIVAGNAANSNASAANSNAAAAAASASAAASAAAEAQLLAECEIDISSGISSTYSSPFALSTAQCTKLP